MLTLRCMLKWQVLSKVSSLQGSKRSGTKAHQGPTALPTRCLEIQCPQEVACEDAGAGRAAISATYTGNTVGCGYSVHGPIRRVSGVFGRLFHCARKW